MKTINCKELPKEKRALAIQKRWDGKYIVIECEIKLVSDGLRRFSRSFDSKYKTYTGARKCLNRWKAQVYYCNHIDLDIIPEDIFKSELVN